MRTLLFVLLSLSLLALPVLAEESPVDDQPASKGSFYQWTNPATGAIEFTDDVKRIPEQMKSLAEQRRWEDVGEDAQITPTMMTAEDYYAAVTRGLERYRAINAQIVTPAVSEPQPYPARTLDRFSGTRMLNRDLVIGGGTVVIVQERRNVDGINKSLYVVYGPSGEELMIAPYPIGAVYQELPYQRPLSR